MELSDLLEECISIEYSQVGLSANYAIKIDKDILYLFFEDSKGLNDWKSNLDFPAKAYKRMGRTIWFAHRGFVKVWKEIEPKLASFILDKNINKIVITGYSHGAAVAMLCHEYVWFNRPDLRDKIEGYGFACPRVFWGIKTRNLKKRWKRFVVIKNRGDIVTHLPPLLLGYSHVGTKVKLGKYFKYSLVEAHLAENIIYELNNYEKHRTVKKINCELIKN